MDSSLCFSIQSFLLSFSLTYMKKIRPHTHMQLDNRKTILLTLLIHEHCITMFSIFLSFLSSAFSVHRCCASFVEFIPKNFFIVDPILNDIFISIIKCSLLVYRKSMDFCILIFYPATLPILPVSSSYFSVDSTEFST